jgi:peptidyl-prolyl cis-trans isomerase C
MNLCFSVRIRRVATVTAIVATAMLVGAPHAAWAADHNVALISGEASVSVLDMQADSLRMPLEMRNIVLQKPDTVLQIANNLYIRRVFAQQAIGQGLEKNPQVVAALQVARDKVLSDAMLEHIDKTAVPSDTAMEALARNEYRAKPQRFKAEEEVKVRHILLAEKTPESKAKAEEVLTELKKGADFATLAKARSADTGSAANGGDLGYFAKGRMVPEFETVAFALQKPGDISGLVESKFGYHILQLDARKPERIRTFEEVRDELIKEMRTKAAQDARASEAAKIQQGSKVNQKAIEAFAETYKTAK